MKNTTLFKRALSVVLTVVMLLGTATIGLPYIDLGIKKADAAYDSTSGKLKFNSNGEFTILQLADIQDSFSSGGTAGIDLRTEELIRLAIQDTEPDLIILTGDNIVGTNDSDDFGFDNQYYARSLKLITNMFVDAYGNNIPWTMTFGNHDYGDNKINGTKITEKRQYELANSGTFDTTTGTRKLQFGTFIDYDETSKIISDTSYGSQYVNNVKGNGTINIYDASGSTAKWQLNLINTGDQVGTIDSIYGYARAGSYPIGFGKERNNLTSGGYGGADTNCYNDIVNWIKGNKSGVTRNKALPSLTFQHIPLQEFYTKLLKTGGSIAPYSTNNSTINGSSWQPKSTSEVADIKGELNETPCCSYYSTSDLYNALYQNNCKGVFYGHDHTNSLSGTVDGMMQAYCPGCGHVEYDGGSNAGVRKITIKTDNTFTTDVVTYASLKEKYGAISYSTVGNKKYYWGDTTPGSKQATYIGHDTVTQSPFMVADGESTSYMNLSSQIFDHSDTDKIKGNGTYRWHAINGLLNSPTVTADLNKGAGGKDMLLGYSTTNNPENAVCALIVYYTENGSYGKDNKKFKYNMDGQGLKGENTADGVTFHPVNARSTGGNFSEGGNDLNDGAGGKYIRLYYSTVKDFRDAGLNPPLPITEVAITDQTTGIPAGYKMTQCDEGGEADLNKGAGGSYLRLYFRTSATTGIEDITPEYDSLCNKIEAYQNAYNSSSSYTSTSYTPFETAYEAADSLKSTINDYAVSPSHGTNYNKTYDSKAVQEKIDALDAAYNALETNLISSGPVVHDGVYFNVPENIYLTPNGTTFKYYQDQTLNENTTAHTATISTNASATDTSGTIQFYYANATSVTISYKNTLVDNSSCSVSCTGFTETSSLNNSKFTTYVTGGSLGSATSGYIEWTATYVDNLDGQTKSVKAYSYVYNPFVDPIICSEDLYNSNGTRKVYAGGFTWISELHDITPDSTNDRYPKMFPLVSKCTAPTSGGAPDGTWVTATDNGHIMSSRYRYYNSGSQNWCAAAHAGTGTLYVDRSRYKNLSQIPNLTWGFAITDLRENGDELYYMFADYSGQTVGANNTNSTSNNGYDEWNRTRTKLIFGNSSTSSSNKQSFSIGIKQNDVAFSGLDDLQSSGIEKKCSVHNFLCMRTLISM